MGKFVDHFNCSNRQCINQNPLKIKKIGKRALPYLVGGTIALSGCSQGVRESYLKEACLELYDILLVDPALADRDGDGALDLAEQSELMRALGSDKLMTGNNFPEILEDREKFIEYINPKGLLGLDMDEVYGDLVNASAHYSRGFGR